MPRTKHETHLWFAEGDERIEIESFDKRLNAKLEKLMSDEPDAVAVYSHEDGSLRCAVLRDRLTLKRIPVRSSKCKMAQSENGKRHVCNLKHSKSKEGK